MYVPLICANEMTSGKFISMICQKISYRTGINSRKLTVFVFPLNGISFTGKNIPNIIFFATQYKAEFTYELGPTNAFIPVSVTNLFKNIIQTSAYLILNFVTNFWEFCRGEDWTACSIIWSIIVKYARRNLA